MLFSTIALLFPLASNASHHDHIVLTDETMESNDPTNERDPSLEWTSTEAGELKQEFELIQSAIKSYHSPINELSQLTNQKCERCLANLPNATFGEVHEKHEYFCTECILKLKPKNVYSEFKAAEDFVVLYKRETDFDLEEQLMYVNALKILQNSVEKVLQCKAVKNDYAKSKSLALRSFFSSMILCLLTMPTTVISALLKFPDYGIVSIVFLALSLMSKCFECYQRRQMKRSELELQKMLAVENMNRLFEVFDQQYVNDFRDKVQDYFNLLNSITDEIKYCSYNRK